MKFKTKIVSLIYLVIIMFSFNYISVGDKNTSSELVKIQKELVKAVNIKKEALEKEKLKELEKKETERKENINFSREDIGISSNLNSEEMKNIFLNYNGASSMAHLAEALVDAEEKYNVNSLVLAAIVALESGFATSRRAVEDNNLTGYEVYSDSSKGRLFSSQYDSILHTAEHLRNNYLTEGAQYYNGMSIDAVQISYCPDEGLNKKWEEKIDMLATSFLEVYKELHLQ